MLRSHTAGDRRELRNFRRDVRYSSFQRVQSQQLPPEEFEDQSLVYSRTNA